MDNIIVGTDIGMSCSDAARNWRRPAEGVIVFCPYRLLCLALRVPLFIVSERRQEAEVKQPENKVHDEGERSVMCAWVIGPWCARGLLAREK